MYNCLLFCLQLPLYDLITHNIVFTEQEMKTKGSETLPRPNMVHHIVEDFLTIWDAPVSHILPLRRFLEDVTGENLRHFFSDDCMKRRLLFQSAPFYCEEDFMEGHGLTGTEDLISLIENVREM